MEKQKSAFTTIVFTGATAGTLDIAAALLNFFITTGKNPIRVLQFIASGVFGADAFGGDALMPLYGLVFHYFIATCWTIIFFLAYRRIKLIRKSWVLSGISYAVVVWTIMTRIVLPLSRVPQIPFDLGKAALAIAILIACIGLPISFGIKKYYASKPS